MTLTVDHESSDRRGQFFLRRDGLRCGTLDYTLAADGTIHIDFVEVAPEARGTGLGKQLVEAAVQWARDGRRKVVPVCSYAWTVMHTSPSYEDVL